MVSSILTKDLVITKVYDTPAVPAPVDANSNDIDHPIPI